MWIAHWVPTSESFFNVDLIFSNPDTIFYENIGLFTSVGPLNVSMVGSLAASPGDASVINFELINNSDSQTVSDVSVSFLAESMECILNMSGTAYTFPEILPGDTINNNDSFVIVINNECDTDTAISIDVNIQSDGITWWKDSFAINIETLGVSKDNLPVAYSLESAYPNPFNPTTSIQYGLPIKQFVNIDIFDLMGRNVKSLISENIDAGYRTIKWDGTNGLGQSVSAGMYIYTMQAGDFRETKKMIFLK